MSGEGEIEDRDALDGKRAAVNAGIASDLYDNFVRIELPLGTRKFACRDGSVIDDIVVWAGLLHYLASKRKGVGRSQDQPLSAQAHARGAVHVFEASGLGADVVGAMSGFDVLIVGAAIEHHVAVRDRISGTGVVVHGVGVQDVGAIVNLGLAAQLENRAVLFLLQGADGDVLFSDRGRR